MQLELVIQALRDRCAVFSNRVAGSMQFKILPESVMLPLPAAYVLPLDDSPQEALGQNVVRQAMTDSFAVVVAISNVPDEKGQTAAHTIDGMRAILWGALLGWRPTLRYNGINYEGGSLLQIDRARVWYQFEFGALMEIQGTDGWQETELAGLPGFEGVNINVDVIDPIADPNLRYPGPDGRIEFESHIPVVNHQDGDFSI